MLRLPVPVCLLNTRAYLIDCNPDISIKITPDLSDAAVDYAELSVKLLRMGIQNSGRSSVRAGRVENENNIYQALKCMYPNLFMLSIIPG